MQDIFKRPLSNQQDHMLPRKVNWQPHRKLASSVAGSCQSQFTVIKLPTFWWFAWENCNAFAVFAPQGPQLAGFLQPIVLVLQVLRVQPPVWPIPGTRDAWRSQEHGSWLLRFTWNGHPRSPIWAIWDSNLSTKVKHLKAEEYDARQVRDMWRGSRSGGLSFKRCGSSSFVLELKVICNF